MPANFDVPAFATRKRRTGASPANRAFIVESMLLLAFLAFSVAIVLQVFSAAGNISKDAHTLSVSEHLASNAAESFGANPQQADSPSYFDEEGLPTNEADAAFMVLTEVDSDASSAGIMYRARITVHDQRTQAGDSPAFELETQRYLSNTERSTL